jgi:hypothetical protein
MLMLWNLKGAHNKQILALQWVLGEYPPKPREPEPVVHGRNCPKVVHDRRGMGHLAEDDGPFEFDGIKYCGRCHEKL